MNKRYFALTFALFLCLTNIAAGQRPNFEFGFVKNDYDLAGEAVWAADAKKEDRIHSKSIASLRAEGIGKVNINGDDIDLKAIKHFLPRRNQRVGRGGYQIWKGRATTLRIDYIFTEKCPIGGDDECFTYHYRGVMTVTHRGKVRKIKIRGFGSS